jgi:hypothetical protein
VNRFIKIALLCILGAAANFGLNTFFILVLKTPLYLDTVFTAAVTFTVGLVPGLVTALLTFLSQGLLINSLHPFILCSFAEVTLIWLLNPMASNNRNLKQKMPTVFMVYTASRLMLLYVLCALAVSVLGGVIDFLYYGLLMAPKSYVSAEDMYKVSLMESNVMLVLKNILARLPVNVVDRFIVIFGGFFTALLLKRTGMFK